MYHSHREVQEVPPLLEVLEVRSEPALASALVPAWVSGVVVLEPVPVLEPGQVLPLESRLDTRRDVPSACDSDSCDTRGACLEVGEPRLRILGVSPQPRTSPPP